MADDVKYIEYKGRAFVREHDTICYGNMTDPCILYMLILSYKKFADTEIPDKILIQVIDSKDPNKIIKQGSKSGLYDAFSIGLIWLEMALK